MHPKVIQLSRLTMRINNKRSHTEMLIAFCTDHMVQNYFLFLGLGIFIGLAMVVGIQ